MTIHLVHRERSSVSIFEVATLQELIVGASSLDNESTYCEQEPTWFVRVHIKYSLGNTLSSDRAESWGGLHSHKEALSKRQQKSTSVLFKRTLVPFLGSTVLSDPISVE